MENMRCSQRARQEQTLIEIGLLFERVATNEQFIAERFRRIIFPAHLITQNLIIARDNVLMESNLYRNMPVLQ